MLVCIFFDSVHIFLMSLLGLEEKFKEQRLEFEDTKQEKKHIQKMWMEAQENWKEEKNYLISEKEILHNQYKTISEALSQVRQKPTSEYLGWMSLKCSNFLFLFCTY